MTTRAIQSQTVDTVSWEQFDRQFRWEQGQHVSLVGTTGSGKSTVISRILKHREARDGHILFIGTKSRDRTLEKLIKEGDYERIKQWPPSPRSRKVVLWPPFVDSDSYALQERVIKQALNKAFGEGSWTIVIDEAYVLTNDLHLGPELNMLWGQGRSADITVVAGAQRPVSVPRYMWTMNTHLFTFWTDDEDDIDRIGEIGYSKRKLIKEEVPALPEFYFFYTRRQSPHSYISKA